MGMYEIVRIVYLNSIFSFIQSALFSPDTLKKDHQAILTAAHHLNTCI
jgi:hypothetical protein